MFMRAVFLHVCMGQHVIFLGPYSGSTHGVIHACTYRRAAGFLIHISISRALHFSFKRLCARPNTYPKGTRRPGGSGGAACSHCTIPPTRYCVQTLRTQLICAGYSIPLRIEFLLDWRARKTTQRDLRVDEMQNHHCSHGATGREDEVHGIKLECNHGPQ